MTHLRDSWNLEKAVMLKVTIYYNKRIQLKTSQWKRHVGQWLIKKRKTRYKLPCVPSQWGCTGTHLIPPAKVCDNTCEVPSLTWVTVYQVLVSRLRVQLPNHAVTVTDLSYTDSSLHGYSSCTTPGLHPLPKQAFTRNHSVRINLSGQIGTAWPKASGMQEHSH